MINDYFQIHKYALNIFLKNIDTLISKYKGTKKECIMFGTSMVVDQLKDTELKISFIIDNAKSRQGMEVYGKKVYSPERLKAEYNDNYLILIASSFQDEMIKQLESYGYMYGKHIVKIIDLVIILAFLFTGFLSSTCFLTGSRPKARAGGPSIIILTHKSWIVVKGISWPTTCEIIATKNAIILTVSWN